MRETGVCSPCGAIMSVALFLSAVMLVGLLVSSQRDEEWLAYETLARSAASRMAAGPLLSQGGGLLSALRAFFASPPPPPPSAEASWSCPTSICAARWMPSKWACVGLADMECPGTDELRSDKGCQVRCGSRNGVPDLACARGHAACRRVPGCVRARVNAVGTWATLKRAVARGAAINVTVDSLPWCVAPGGPVQRARRSKWRAPDPGGEGSAGRSAGDGSNGGGIDGCGAGDALCALVMSSASAPDQYTARPESSLPPRLSVVTRPMGDYPRAVHAAASVLAFAVASYDSLPETLAVIVDHGDRHLSSGVDVCAQSAHLRDLHAWARAPAGGERRVHQLPRPLKSIAPAVAPRLARFPGLESPLLNASGGAGGGEDGRRRFACDRHVLSAAEAAAWEAVLSPMLGPPPPAVHSYKSGFEIAISREALRSVPRRAYARLLLEAAGQSARAQPLASLLPRVWGALLARQPLDSRFVCDETNGWAAGPRVTYPVHSWDPPTAAPAAAARARRPPRGLAPPSVLPLAVAGPAAIGSVPHAPSRRERGAKCGAASVACAVVAVHREGIDWTRQLGSAPLTLHPRPRRPRGRAHARCILPAAPCRHAPPHARRALRHSARARLQTQADADGAARLAKRLP